MCGRGRGVLLRSIACDDAGDQGNEASGGGGTSGSGASIQNVESQSVSSDHGRAMKNLNVSCSNLAIGRVRTKGLSDILEAEASSSSGIHRGGGRGQIMRNILFKTDTPDKTEEEAKVSSTTDIEPKPSTTPFYQPENTKGVKGVEKNLICNYIRLKLNSEKGVYVYDTCFDPFVESVGMRVQYLNEHLPQLAGAKLFDGVTLYLPIRLNKKCTTFISTNATDGTKIALRLLFKKKQTVKDCLTLYNILFNRVMKTLNYVRMDRKVFDPTNPKIIPQAKLEIWPGYVIAVDEYEGGLMLCCDVSHRVISQKSVYEYLEEAYQGGSAEFQSNAKRGLLGSVVISRYNNRTYRIDDVVFDKSPQSTFDTQSGPITYIEYYSRNYNITIKDVKQPLLISIRKQKKNEQFEQMLCLVPELCYFTGLRDEFRTDYRLMQEITSVSKVTPNQRIYALEKFYENINKCPEAQKILEDWGLQLVNSHQNLKCRQYDEESISFANKSFPVGRYADFSKYAGNNKLLEVVDLYDWLILYCRPDMKYVNLFIDHMSRNARGMGVRVAKPRIVVLENDRTDTYVHALRNSITKNIQIVVCICPTNRVDRYAAIKKICCVEIPVPSQVIHARTLVNNSKNRSIVQKIALQMNCKLGGTLWSINIPFKNIMICGIDIYHDTNGYGKSVAGFVASLDAKYTKWYSKATFQSRKGEFVDGLCFGLISALQAYKNENHALPKSIIIYRDGVGNGQLQVCADYEITQLQNACSKIDPEHSIPITFIVVQKRNNTRFFMKTASGYENPAPGTVVDDTVTRFNMYDFYLVSQSAKQGILTPSHYIVLRDDAKFSPDILQRLSYKLCFMYYNWSGSIKIPACVQYAHKIAYLIGENVRQVPAEELSNKLFYL